MKYKNPGDIAALPGHRQQTALDVRFGGFSSAGIKQNNEDAFAAHQPKTGVRFFKGSVACLADGVSCSENAQQASQTSVTTFIDDYYSTPDSWPVKQSAARVLTSLNSWLFHHGQQTNARHNGLVTTFSSIVFKSTTAHLLHIGDSRIYRLRDGQLQQLTRDHAHARGKEKSYLTRALGMDSHLEVDYQQVGLQQGDLFMLSSDGVHEFLSNDALRIVLQEAGKSDKGVNPLEASAETMVAQALTNGSDDNLTCLLVQVNNLPMESVDEAHRQLTELSIPPVMEPGQKIDGYEIKQILHSGTRSHIYIVQHPETCEKLVLKAPSQNFEEDARYLEGFIREQWVGRRLNHPGVMKIYPHPEDSPFLYHLCEYLEGTTLRQWMIDNPQPPLEKVRELIRGIIIALRVFQRMGMVHRDVKPENIIINFDGRVQIIDFGTVQINGLEEVSSVLDEEIPVGSVDYIAPEYLNGERGQHHSDMFSLGVIIYEMLTGHLPFKTEGLRATNPHGFRNWNYRSACEQRNDIPRWLDIALQKACNPNPAKRYHVMSELLQDICQPNRTLLQSHLQKPLIERNPLRFWQGTSAIFLVLLLVQSVMLLGV